MFGFVFRFVVSIFRIESATDECIACENKVIEIRRTNAKLEKQLERLKSEGNSKMNISKNRPTSRSSKKVNKTVEELYEDIEELQTKYDQTIVGSYPKESFCMLFCLFFCFCLFFLFLHMRYRCLVPTLCTIAEVGFPFRERIEIMQICLSERPEHFKVESGVSIGLTDTLICSYYAIVFSIHHFISFYFD